MNYGIDLYNLADEIHKTLLKPFLFKNKRRSVSKDTWVNYKFSQELISANTEINNILQKSFPNIIPTFKLLLTQEIDFIARVINTKDSIDLAYTMEVELDATDSKTLNDLKSIIAHELVHLWQIDRYYTRKISSKILSFDYYTEGNNVDVYKWTNAKGEIPAIVVGLISYIKEDNDYLNLLMSCNSSNIYQTLLVHEEFDFIFKHTNKQNKKYLLTKIYNYLQKEKENK